MLLAYPPKFIKRVYPSLIWDIKTDNKELFLTFDDGPTPGVTEIVLDLLLEYKAKATFFCLGKNVEKNPNLFKRIIAEGHSIGNHSYSHKNGWNSQTSGFLQDVKKFDKLYSTELFRPPYGRIKNAQIKILKKRFRIIMWSILTQDYNENISPIKCSEISTSNWKKGSILVFHDSLKAQTNMLFALKDVLVKAQKENWTLSSIQSKR